jgi:hypothetical protein
MLKRRNSGIAFAKASFFTSSLFVEEENAMMLEGKSVSDNRYYLRSS